MSDEVPVYVFIADEAVQVGSLTLEPDGSFTGSVGENMYKTLVASKKAWFFAILPGK